MVERIRTRVRGTIKLLISSRAGLRCASTYVARGDGWKGEHHCNDCFNITFGNTLPILYARVSVYGALWGCPCDLEIRRVVAVQSSSLFMVWGEEWLPGTRTSPVWALMKGRRYREAIGDVKGVITQPWKDPTGKARRKGWSSTANQFSSMRGES